MKIAPVYTGDYYSDEFIRDPYPHYAKMRSLGPVVYLPKLENYALTQHAVVQPAMCRAMVPSLFLDALDSIRPEIERVANEVVEGLVELESFDAIEDLARQLPLKTVTEMVGLPDFGKDNILKWATAAFDVLGVQSERGVASLEATAEMRGFILGQLNRESLKAGSWTSRVLDLVDRGSLDPELTPFAIRDYINPHLDTTISATGQLIWQLAHNPILWEKLRRNPELCGNAVNEAVRLATPIRNYSRTETRGTVVAGVKIPEGAQIMMLLASANRDERVFTNAEQFDLTRDPQSHVGFGSGIYMSIGMHFAQLEMMSLLKAMIPRIGNIVVGLPEIALNNKVAGFSKLPCVFTEDKRKLTAVRGRRSL